MKFVSTFAILGVLALAGCGTRQTTTTEARVSNSDVEQMVKSKLAANQLERIDVDADLDKNQITVSGTVPSEPMRSRAVDIAKTTRPGVIVVDKIDVKPQEVSRTEYTEQMARDARAKAESTGDKIGKSLDDAWIHTKIVSKLATDSTTPARKINVDVENNTVTLRGKVDSKDAKDEAGRVATQTDGVKRVVNHLVVAAS